MTYFWNTLLVINNNMIHFGGVDKAEPLCELEPIPNQRFPHPLVGDRRLHKEYAVHLYNAHVSEDEDDRKYVLRMFNLAMLFPQCDL